MTDHEQEKKQETKTALPIAVQDFITQEPIGSAREVITFLDIIRAGVFQVNFPELNMYCPTSSCEKETFFEEVSPKNQLVLGLGRDVWVIYRCRNCKQYEKKYSIEITAKTTKISLMMKFGEWPKRSKSIPPKAYRLIQPDYQLFLNGLECEREGLGIGAMAYYRRVIENNKIRLVDEIIKVAKSLGAKKEQVEIIAQAKDEVQFKKSIESINRAMPEILLIKGHNPLTLLHKAMSIGLHGKSDAECLDIARHVKTVLIEFAEKVDFALHEDNHLKESVTKLLEFKDGE